MGYVRAVAFCCLVAGCSFDGYGGGGNAKNPPGDDTGGGGDAMPAPDAPPMRVSCGNLSCDPHADCDESGSNATCSCKPGFTDGGGAQPGLACNDIDECMMESACPDDTDCENTPGSFECYTPAKCKDAKDHHRPDGDTTIYAGGDKNKPWKAYCDGDDDYLELQPNASTNYARFAASSIGNDVVTTYAAVRIDPSSFVVDIKDGKHATSTGGTFAYGQQVRSMMYGTAMDCSNDAKADGTGNIDLTGTAFRVKSDQQWVKQGDPGRAPDSRGHGGRDAPSGTATTSSDNQVIALTGGGDCGWVAPANGVQVPFNGLSNNTQLLHLEYRSPVGQ